MEEFDQEKDEEFVEDVLKPYLAEIYEDLKLREKPDANYISKLIFNEVRLVFILVLSFAWTYS